MAACKTVLYEVLAAGRKNKAKLKLNIYILYFKSTVRTIKRGTTNKRNKNPKPPKKQFHKANDVYQFFQFMSL